MLIAEGSTTTPDLQELTPPNAETPHKLRGAAKEEEEIKMTLPKEVHRLNSHFHQQNLEFSIVTSMNLI